MIPGEILSNGGPVEINVGCARVVVAIRNTGDVPIHLTAHFHVFEANPRLRFDRRKAFGMRPDLPSGGGLRIEPGEALEIPLVSIGGNQVVRGFAGAIDGPLADIDVAAALAHLIERGYLHEPSEPASP